MDVFIKDGSFAIHETNIRTLSLEIYKVKHNLSEICLKDLFSAVNGNYNIRSQSVSRISGVNTFFLHEEFN